MLYDPKWKPSETTTEEWRSVLLRAADLLENEGWIVGNLESGTQRCAIGALWVAEGNSFNGESDEQAAYARAEQKGTAAWHLRQWLRAQDGPESNREVFEWNDDQFSSEPVIATMRKVANAV